MQLRDKLHHTRNTATMPSLTTMLTTAVTGAMMYASTAMTSPAPDTASDTISQDITVERVTDTVKTQSPAPPTDTTQTNSARSYTPPRTDHDHRGDRIPILMYHKVGDQENRYTVSPERLRSQLRRLHQEDYYVVSMNDYLTADLSHVPSGKHPVVITFDDAAPSQFQLNDKGEPTKESAVGILQDAFEHYDGFGHGATFYVSYAGDDHDFRHPFGGQEHKKIQWLQSHDYTVGYHTPYHSDNEDASTGDIDEQTTILGALINDVADDEPALKHYAHPFGADPERKAARDSLRDTYTSIVNAWGGFAPHPESPGFDRYEIPRVETNAETFDMVLSREAYQAE